MCTKSRYIMETYDLVIGTTPATWIMQGTAEYIPRERMGYVVRATYDSGRLYTRLTADTSGLTPNMTLSMGHVMNLFEIIVLDDNSRVDRDVQQRLSMFHKKTKSIPIPVKK